MGGCGTGESVASWLYFVHKCVLSEFFLFSPCLAHDTQIRGDHLDNVLYTWESP